MKGGVDSSMPRYTKRYWVLAIILSLLVSLGVGVYSYLRQSDDVPPPVRVSVPTASVKTTLRSEATLPVVARSVPKRVMIPAIGVDVEIDEAVPCPLNDAGMVEPDFRFPMKACYYTALNKPYQLPGTTTTDLSVIVGHTWRKGDAAFNPMYDWQAANPHVMVELGDELLLKTQASGEHVLVYQAVQIDEVDKYGPDHLGQSTKVWGTKPIPNWLVTLACLQPSNSLEHSTKVIAIGWKLVGAR